MRYLLDTNIVAYIIKKRPLEVFRKLQSVPFEEISISAIVIAELWFGVEKSQLKEQNKQALQEFLAPLNVLDFNAEAAKYYAEIRADLERRGQIIGANDLLIAAQALSANLVLVTNNTREFERIERLKIENWIA